MRFLKSKTPIPVVLALFTPGLALVAGCGAENGIEKVPVVPVSTKVLFEGQPLEGAFVILHPKSGVDSKAQAAQGYVDKDGTFKATTYKDGDGAAIGEFAVTVELRPAVQTDDGWTRGANVLPERYANPQTTDLVIKVAKGQTAIPPLNLTR